MHVIGRCREGGKTAGLRGAVVETLAENVVAEEFVGFFDGGVVRVVVDGLDDGVVEVVVEVEGMTKEAVACVTRE